MKIINKKINEIYTYKKILKQEKKEIRNWFDVGLKQKSYVRIEMPIKIEKNQLVNKIGKLSKCETYVYINELMSFMNKDIREKFNEGGI